MADATLLHQVDLFRGLRPNGSVLVNSSRTPTELGVAEHLPEVGVVRAVVVPATELARRFLERPTPNTALLGAFAALGGPVSLPSVLSAIRATFPPAVAAPNQSCANAAYEQIRSALSSEPREASRA